VTSWNRLIEPGQQVVALSWPQPGQCRFPSSTQCRTLRERLLLAVKKLRSLLIVQRLATRRTLPGSKQVRVNASPIGSALRGTSQRLVLDQSKLIAERLAGEAQPEL
jgi:hypothetical protein